ncbi:MAG: HAMP domain-containing histidine kinase [Bacteroidales bacterium]|nr:HAMP domain-containing histidine kinase [Bacteroidales bacterium]
MKFYTQTRSWKIILLISGSVFIFSYILAIYNIVGKISENERRQVKAWANTVQKKADMVNYTEDFFKELREEEQRRVELLAMVYNYLDRSGIDDVNNDIFFEVIRTNKNIPVLWVDQDDNILSANNVSEEISSAKKMTDEIRQEFSQYDPIRITVFGKKQHQYLYYADSKLYKDLFAVLDEMNRSFFDETADNIAAVPVIITDSLYRNVYSFGNIDEELIRDSASLQKTLEKMRYQNDPIIVSLPEQGKRYVYYMDSEILRLIRIFPFIQLFVLMVFIILGYVVVNVARNSEQNQVWAGMAKETAHQLGTPTSSMIAWIELLKLQDNNREIAVELEKDVARLHVVAARFSKIGSEPSLDYHNIIPLIQESLNYLSKRISSHVSINYYHPEHPVCCFIDEQLFSWVIENLTRNAVDAMEGSGILTVDVKEDEKNIIIDFSDTGKGIPKKLQKKVFVPGYTTKKRGWGLGLTLTKRILNYSKGKIFVKQSAVGVGTTFRILFKKND